MSGVQYAGNSPSHMGDVVTAAQVITGGLDPRRARNIILLLTVSVALMMTGFGVIFPIFARRFSEFGSGVEALGLMAMVYSLAGIAAAPVMGALADRYGRRPQVLGALAAFVAANIGFVLAPSTEAIIVVRALEGALTAGFAPAAMGIVGDIAPEDRRGQWIGILMGGYSVGWMFGPVLGGVLYDAWGFAAPFIVSAALALVALGAASILVPETRPHEVRHRDRLRQRRAAAMTSAQAVSFWAALPQPVSAFALLLFVSFITLFAWTFVEPQLMFYVYEDLDWTTTQFGAAAGGYGLAAAVGDMTLGRLSDRLGRKPVLILGILLFSAQFVGMMITSHIVPLLASFLLAGLGEALWVTALNAFYLDITPEQHRSRVMGIKGAAASLGGVLGPLLVVAVARITAPREIFLTSAILVVLTALLALVILREPRHVSEGAAERTVQTSEVRAMAALDSLRGVVLRAAAVRAMRRGEG